MAFWKKKGEKGCTYIYTQGVAMVMSTAQVVRDQATDKLFWIFESHFDLF